MKNIFDKVKEIAGSIIIILTAIVMTITVYTTITSLIDSPRKTTVYLKCPYSSYTVVSQEIKDRSHSIFKLDKKNDSDVFAGADGLFYSAKYVSDKVVDITAIGYEDNNTTRIFKINLKED